MVRLENTDYNWHHQPCFYVFDTHKRDLDIRYIPCEEPEKIFSSKTIQPDDEYDNDKIDKLANEIKEGFKDNTDKKQLKKVITEQDVRRSVKKIIIEALDKLIED